MKTKYQLSIVSGVILILLTANACRKIDPIITDPATYQYIGTGNGIIGTKGGEVYIADSNSLIRDAIVAIKAGILLTPIRFTITSAPANITIPSKPNARIINIQPDSIVLLANVTIGMSYRHLDSNNTEWIKLYYYNPGTGQLTELDNPDFDVNRKIMYASSNKLGYFTILQESAPTVETGNFTDIRDNQIYKWVKVNNQVWMAQNLNFATGSGSYSYNDVAGNATTYGRLYDWYTAASACPAGWHLPSHDEWFTLEKYLGQPGTDQTSDGWKEEGFVGSKLKATSGWLNGGNGVDDIQFKAIPGGFKDGDGVYYYLGHSARFWTRSENNDKYWARYLEFDHEGIYWALRSPDRAMSVRCIQGEISALAVVQTNSIDNITNRSASATGNVLTNGGSTVTERGICWNTTGFPLNSESHAASGTGTGSYTVNLTSLIPGSTYYVRAYAINNSGTAYGSQRTFTTDDQLPIETGTMKDPRDQRTYKTVKFNDVWWMAENLNYQTNTGSWCYNNFVDNCDDYGKLYDWITAESACPDGWYLPTDDDWMAIEEFLGMTPDDAAAENWRHTGDVGLKMKSAAGWLQSGGGSNESQFSVFPGGFRDGDGIFYYLGSEARFWTSTRNNAGDPWVRFLAYDDSGVYRSTRGITRGMSVRCIQGQNASLPVVTTSAISNITNSSATCGGNVVSAGGASVSARGVCWNTTGNPLINEHATADGSGAGMFASEISGLTPNTEYFVRAYATNSYGTAYGSTVAFTTSGAEIFETSVMTDPRDQKSYNIVKIGNAWWFAQNLNYQNGADSWCYNNAAANCQQYGSLYTYSSASVACPTGWHLPTDDEWRQMEITLGMSQAEANLTGWRVEGNVGIRMKSTSGWGATGNGVNDCHMTVLPGGFRDADGLFYYAGTSARFWTATRSVSQDPWIRYFDENQPGVYRDVRGETRGFSVRCVKN